MNASPKPTSYRIVGPPDILFDVLEDFEAVGWRTSHAGWKAVVTAPPEDAGHTPPAWPTEVTLAGVAQEPHEQACAAYLA